MFSTNGVGTATLSLVHLRFLVELCVAAHSFVRCFMDRCSVLRLLYCGHCIVRSPIYKKSLKILKCSSEAVNRRTDNTMAKSKRTNNHIQN